MYCMRIFTLIILFTCFQHCNNRSESSNEKSKEDRSTSIKGGKELIAGRDYSEFVRIRIYDKTGFEKEVEAYSFLAPKDWKVSGEVTWNRPGTACAGNNMSVEMVSPDGRYKFQWFPNDLWMHQPDPEMQAFVPNEKYCRGGQPMSAEAYLKEVFAPGDLGGAEIISVKENPEGLRTINESNTRMMEEMRSYGAATMNFSPGAVYANVKWNDGREGLVICAVNNIETVVPNIYTGGYSTTYSSTGTSRIMISFPAGEKELAASIISVIMGSVRTNPAWKESVDNFWYRYRQQKHADNIGKIKMMDALTKQIGENAIKQGQENLNRMDASMRSSTLR